MVTDWDTLLLVMQFLHFDTYILGYLSVRSKYKTVQMLRTLSYPLTSIWHFNTYLVATLDDTGKRSVIGIKKCENKKVHVEMKKTDSSSFSEENNGQNMAASMKHHYVFPSDELDYVWFSLHNLVMQFARYI